MRRGIAAALLACTWAAAAPAGDSAAASFFAQLQGHWRGEGETRGMASVQDLRWAPALDGAFQRLHLINLMTAADGREWRFQAEAYYRIAPDGTISGTWHDSRGMTLPLSGQVDGDTLTIDWGTDETERGRSRYRLAPDALEVTDEVQTPAGEWRVFGRSRLIRVAEDTLQ